MTQLSRPRFAHSPLAFHQTQAGGTFSSSGCAGCDVPDVICRMWCSYFFFSWRPPVTLVHASSRLVDSADLRLSCRFFGWAGYGRLCQKNALCQDQLLVAPIHTQAREGYCHWRVDKIDKALRRQLMECSTSNVTTSSVKIHCWPPARERSSERSSDQDSADHRCWAPALVAPQQNHHRQSPSSEIGSLGRWFADGLLRLDPRSQSWTVMSSAQTLRNTKRVCVIFLEHTVSGRAVTICLENCLHNSSIIRRDILSCACEWQFLRMVA